ncbi:MAG: hypothetical protein KDK41_16185 [Leptospiraceae bacterium]|nr:hypothetical protein [Leptospiraceae bacterium]
MRNIQKIIIRERHFKKLLFITLLLLTHILSGETPMTQEDSADIHLSIDRSDSPWRGLTSTAEMEESNLKIQARVISDNSKNILTNLQAYQKSNDFLLYRSEDQQSVYANAKYFSDLKCIDATRTVGNDENKIGNLTPEALKTFSTLQIAAILIKGEIIKTYWHLGAELDLIKIIKQDDSDIVYWQGEHSYCTNQCREAPLNFAVEINRQNGEMRVKTLYK